MMQSGIPFTHSEEETYSRNLPLSSRNFIDSVQNGSGGTSTSAVVRITLLYPNKTHSTSTSVPREILLRLTSDIDPLFFFYLRIPEFEYPGLKQNQGLLVDFNGFPAQLISLLDKCGDDKFILVLNSGRDITVLDIVESNPFKYLSHLSLVIQPGSDGDVKKYLAQANGDLKKENDILSTKLTQVHTLLESELTRLKTELSVKEATNQNLKEEIQHQHSVTSEKYFRELSSEKDKLLRFQTELSTKFETEKFEIDRAHREKITSLDIKLTNLEREKRDYEQDKFRNDSLLLDLEGKLRNREEDLKLMTHELQILRKNNGKLDADYHEKQRALGAVNGKLNGLEAELQDKVGLIGRQQDLISSLSQKGAQIDEKRESLSREVEELRMNLRDVSSELNKANDIIRKLQDDGRQLTRKLKRQETILSTQESQLTDTAEKLIQSNTALKTAAEKLTQFEIELNDTSRCRKELEERLKGMEESLTAKENMITYLSKQLNDYEGLSNLDKFRQTMNLTSSLNDTFSGRNTTAPSWMHIYNSTLGTTAQQTPPVGVSDNGDGKGKKSVQLPPVQARPPTWAKSNKATLDNLLKSRKK